MTVMPSGKARGDKLLSTRATAGRALHPCFGYAGQNRQQFVSDEADSPRAAGLIPTCPKQVPQPQHQAPRAACGTGRALPRSPRQQQQRCWAPPSPLAPQDPPAPEGAEALGSHLSTGMRTQGLPLPAEVLTTSVGTRRVAAAKPKAPSGPPDPHSPPGLQHPAGDERCQGQAAQDPTGSRSHRVLPYRGGPPSIPPRQDPPQDPDPPVLHPRPPAAPHPQHRAGAGSQHPSTSRRPPPPPPQIYLCARRRLRTRRARAGRRGSRAAG